MVFFLRSRLSEIPIASFRWNNRFRCSHLWTIPKYSIRKVVGIDENFTGDKATPFETVSQCHSEAIAEESYVRNWLLFKYFSQSLLWTQKIRFPTSTLRSKATAEDGSLGLTGAKGSKWHKEPKAILWYSLFGWGYVGWHYQSNGLVWHSSPVRIYIEA